MKLSKLTGIAHNAIHLGEAFNPLTMLHITLPDKIQVDLITGKFTPELDKGDDIRKFYEDTMAWFRHALYEESIPLDIIEEAKIIIEKNTQTNCIIKAAEEVFGYPPGAVKNYLEHNKKN